jgi:hypothetical protein
MATQRIPIYIPVYISSATYEPARVLPRILFFNGMVGCESFYIADENNGGRQQDAFPYFDNYNVVSGSFPTTDSKSLLFTNETAVYGQTPTTSLYTEYWEKYIQLLYNPRTRLLNCSAIIPLADYFDMQLNDVVNFRGNYYHLRAINDYSLKDGTCNLQLLGPIIADTFSREVAPPPPPPPPPPPVAAPATASIKLAEYNASPTAFLDANLFVSGTSYFFSGDFTQSISGGAVANVTLEAKDAASTVWGSFKTASATLSILDNGTPVTSSTQYYYSGSGDLSITFPTTFTAGHLITISGSTLPVTGSTPPPPTGSADLDWSYSETGGANGEMKLYVNLVAVETHTSTAAGTYLVYPGDTISLEVEILTPCGAPDTYANVEVNGNIITDIACANNAGVSLTTGTYTVVSGDIGSTLITNAFASCDGGCL